LNLLLYRHGFRVSEAIRPRTSKVAGEEAKLGHVHPHMLRHGCGYYFANEGYDTRLIQHYLGHRDPRHTARYTRTAARRFEGLWKK
jgi:site-specific recombinase XerD